MAPDQGRSFGNANPRARYTTAIEQSDGVVRANAGGPLSYIKHVLQPGETVRYQGSTHWMLYFPAILLVAAGLVTLILTWGAAQPYCTLVAIAC